MHIEKNVCKNILNTILNVKWKSKYHLNARKDLEEMKIRPELHLQYRGGKPYMLAAAHSFDKKEKEKFLNRIFSLKLPDGYSSKFQIV